jgi:DNA-binding transcriptional LysR family regulator
MSDILAFLILPPLLARKPMQSRLAYSTVHLPPADTIEALERDEVDVAVSMGLDPSTAIHAEKLLADRMVCVMRTSHPIARRRLTFKTFIAQDYVKQSMSPTDLRFVDSVLADMGHKRRIALNVPHWLVIPHVLKRTDLLAVMPGRLAAALNDDELSAFDLPFDSAPFDWMMYWHRRHDRSKASLWLRNELRQVCAAF